MKCRMVNKIFDRYGVGQSLGVLKSQTDDIVDELHKKGLIKKLGSSKVLLTFEGKE